jgi:hypothetical protein
MSVHPRSRLASLLRIGVAALAAIYVVSFCVLAVVRLSYPYEVDPLEGNMLAMALRVLHGEPLYAPPSVDYTAFCYPPLYFHVAAAVMRVIGPGYAALRAVSLVATVATAATIYAVLRRERVRPWLALAAVAAFIGGYARTHYVGDAGRVDALALALALAAIAAMLSGSTLRSAAVAGCLGGLAILAKQPMAVLVAGAAAYQLGRGPRLRAVVFVAATAASALAALAWMGLLFDPWLAFYCLDVPASHHLRAWDLAVLAPVFVVTTLPIALGAPLVDRRWRRAWLADPWSITTLGYLAMSLVARAKEGGSANVFLPMVALAAIQLGRYLESLCDRLPRTALALLAGQLALLWWSPLAIWPTARDVARGDRVVAQIAALPGDVYAMAFPAYAVLAGKPWHAHYIALCDLQRLAPGIADELAQLVASGRLAAVLPPFPDLGETDGCDVPGLADHYRRAGTLDAIDAAAQPSDAAAVFGGPQLFELVHGGRLGPIYTSEPQQQLAR